MIGGGVTAGVDRNGQLEPESIKKAKRPGVDAAPASTGERSSRPFKTRRRGYREPV